MLHALRIRARTLPCARLYLAAATFLLLLTACGGATRLAGSAPAGDALVLSQVAQAGMTLRVPYSVPASAPLYYGGGSSDIVISVQDVVSGTVTPIGTATGQSGDLPWDTTGMTPGCYQPVYEAPPASGLPEGLQPMGEPICIFNLAAADVPSASMSAGDPASVTMTFGFPSGSGAYRLLADVDGDPATTGDQTVLASGTASDGTVPVPIDTSSLPAGVYTILADAADGAYGATQLVEAVPGPARDLVALRERRPDRQAGTRQAGQPDDRIRVPLGGRNVQRRARHRW